MNTPTPLFIAALLGAMAIFLPSTAPAQTYPCGAGPGPGEVQVGVTGGSHGIAPIPVCAPAGGDASGGAGGAGYGAAPVAEMPIDNYIAVAGHPKLSDVWATWGQYRQEAAEIVVLDACNKTMGGGCEVLLADRNVSVVTARDKQGRMHVASGSDGRQALKAVKALCKSRGTTCKFDKAFHALLRGEPPFAAAILRGDFDRDGAFKVYYFPPSSVVPVPRRGTPDAGVGKGADIVSKLPDLPGIRKVHYSPNGAWLLRNGDRKGLGCSLTYVRDDQRVLFVGPTATDKRGALMIASKALPATAAARETKASMSGDRGTVEVRVLHLPTGVGDDSVLLMPTDLPTTIASISDRSPLSIVLEGKPVVDMQIEGGAKARTAMQQCMTGRR